MSTNIDISHLNKADVLAALYNHSKQQGMGFMNPKGQQQMTREEAEMELIAAGDNLYFDYLNGRVMKVNLKGDSFSPALYDRDNGKGAAQEAIDSIKSA